jgi:hypothetical protein
VTIVGLAKATEIAAALSAILLARRRPEHVPAAVALLVLAAVALLRGPLNSALPPSPNPRQGLELVLVYVDGAAELATVAAVAGLAVAVAVRAEHQRRAFAAVVATWALASIVLAALYPSPVVTGPGLARVYVAADLLGLFVSSIALITWAARGIAAKRSPNSASMVALSLAVLDGAILLAPFSPWRGNVYGSSFDGPSIIITFFFAVFTAAQVIAWKFTRKTG